jgi:hypothetical protein
MNNRMAVVVLATIMASPALAQSHDPSTGTRNIDMSVITARSATVSRERPMYQGLAITRPHTHETRN